jgi:hypothetical protein
MSFYPPDLFYHFKPLVLISGLTNEESLPENPLDEVAERFIVDQPLVENPVGEDLIKRFRSKCHPLIEWEPRLVNKRGGISNGHLLNVRFTGRVG